MKQSRFATISICVLFVLTLAIISVQPVDAATDTTRRAITIKRLDQSQGVPNVRFVTAASNGETILLGGSVFRSGKLFGQLWSYRNGKYTNLSPALRGRTTAITGIGWNGSYWLIGSERFLLRYDGKQFADLSPAFAADCFPEGYPHELSWGTSLWIITGTLSDGCAYDGTTFSALPVQDTNLVGAGSPSWNAAQSAWLMYFNTSRGGPILKKFDGTTLQSIAAPPVPLSGLSITSDGRRWMVSGFDKNDLYRSYLTDGRTFTATSAPIHRLPFSTMSVWDGTNWLLHEYNYETNQNRLYLLSRDGRRVKQLYFTYRARDFFQQPTTLMRVGSGWWIVTNRSGHGVLFTAVYR